jgi:hypothetical protein
LDWPQHGLLFDVENNTFWPESWGPRPDDASRALEVAREQFVAWPKLVPLYSHRYLPAAPSAVGAPVFSVYQTDVIYYGANLVDYIHAEFGGTAVTVGTANYLPPWSLLALGEDVP